MMEEKCLSTAVLYVALESVLLTEDITAGTVVMSLCLFVVMTLSILIPEASASGIVLRCAMLAGCFIAAGVYLGPDAAGRLIPVSLPAALCVFYEERLAVKNRKFRKIQDTDRELEMKLRERNKRLIAEQDNEIRLATMSERNRIAREIHDNVGHLLSRALIMLGAIRTVSAAGETGADSGDGTAAADGTREDGTREDGTRTETDGAVKTAGTQTALLYLDQLEATLDTAMHEMRKSVHDLHDDSVDIRKNIDDMVKELESTGRCSVVTDIDAGSGLDKNIRITLTAILREAVANYLRHSNGDRVEIVLHEHPGFITLSVADNGILSEEDREKIRTGIGDNIGVGLNNIRERADSLGGTAAFYTDHGFRVFVNLPKGKS